METEIYPADDNFYSLGYTEPDEAVRLRKTLQKKNSSSRSSVNNATRHPRRNGSVRDFESDTDHRDAMEALPLDYEDEEPPMQPIIPGMGRAAAKAFAYDLKRKAIRQQYRDDPVLCAAVLRAHYEKSRK